MLDEADSLSYASTFVERQFIAKIGRDNTPSIKLFESLGFEIAKVVEVFNEVELRFSGEAQWPAVQTTSYA